MKRNASDNCGLTLVEVLVASIVAVILGGIIFAVFFMYTNESRHSTSRFFLQQQCENVSRQIAVDVRKATLVLKEGETSTNFGMASDTVSSVFLWDNSGTFTRYTIQGNNLLEGSGQVPYTTGGRKVNLVPDSSYFILHPQRKQVTIHLSLYNQDANRSYDLNSKEEVIQCRN